MAFKMKGPTFFNVGKGYHKMPDGSIMADTAMKHYVDDNKEHNDPSHPDDLQTDEEHKSGKVESEGGDDKAYLRSLEKKKKDGNITKAEQSALDRLNVAHD